MNQNLSGTHKIAIWLKSHSLADFEECMVMGQGE